MCDDFRTPIREKRLPGVVVIGARKGGTRALIEFLKLHPLLKSSGPEIHYFDCPKKFSLGLSWYRDQMPILEENQIAMEKTPGYFHTPHVPDRIKQTLPDAKFLLIVRDPVKRLVSDYNQFRSQNMAKGETYPKLEEFIFTKSGNINTKYPPLTRSIYHLHLARWYNVFPKSSIYVVDGDTFIREPWEELKKVERFLKVYPHIESRNFYFNETKGFYCARDIRSKGIWECARNKCLSKSKGRQKPPVDPQTLITLRQYFRAHNKIFESMINRTFTWDD
ncbi:heparan sulfate glucosamine 3-O-sulfotransferase 1-like [Lepeophtheirus salmonis]|uniref:heparan sulfate glucosamine 3-O-sulfotransferase 1-like n=1 Tax=Lepeophtheirus salmonis TaxID=72036 RepID=UPI001AEAC1A9|nr:heparan sulfate glucosamine 3-O-sulfotransferase 1-like isoform X2 [Lepeophtheirus salmonis]XP_040578655.1 heparan sulfate glucosamine 3-O-sulfotransferase 1-like isoform X2 [Lepeophtheirus salmonis]